MARMRPLQDLRPALQSVCIAAGCALLGWNSVVPANHTARAGEQFAVIRPQLQFDTIDAGATYPRRSSSAHPRLLAGNRGNTRRHFGQPSGSRFWSGNDSAATGKSRRGVRRKPSSFEGTGAAPLLRDLPAAERDPSPTRRRALGW